MTQELVQTAKEQAVLPSTVEALLTLGTKNPTELDGIATALGSPARLINPHFATRVTWRGQPALHLPVQISTSDRGRPSLYYLEPGKPTTAGYLVTASLEVLERVVTRLTGTGKAQTGDVYLTEIRTLDGEVLHRSRGRLVVINPERGYGKLVPVDATGQPEPDGFWIAWSFIAVF